MAALEDIQQLTGSPSRVLAAKLQQQVGQGGIGLPGASMWPAGELVVAGAAVLLEAGDPLVGGLPGDAEAIGQIGEGVTAELEVLEEAISLFAHGNTFPGHGQPPSPGGSVTHVLRISVTYVLRLFCYLCPGLVQM